MINADDPRLVHVPTALKKIEDAYFNADFDGDTENKVKLFKEMQYLRELNDKGVEWQPLF